MDCGLDLFSDLGRNLIHAVRGAGVFLNLAKNFLAAVTTSNESQSAPTSLQLTVFAIEPPTADESSTEECQGKVN